MPVNFADNASCTCKKIQRRYRMNKELFMKLLQGVRDENSYFMMKKYVVKVFGFIINLDMH
jgi:hypothetical protein